MENSSTLWSSWEDCQHYPELIRRTTVQSGAWRTADRCIPSEDRSQTRLSTLPLSLSSGDWLDYEDLDTWEESRNTMDNLHATRQLVLGKWRSPSIPYTPTNAGEDSQCSSSLCISRPQQTQGKMQDPEVQHKEHQPNHTWRSCGVGGNLHVPA